MLDCLARAYVETFLVSISTVQCFLGVSASFKAKLLEEANKFRRMHSAVPLVWSDKLATKAQIWAEKLAREQQ